MCEVQRHSFFHLIKDYVFDFISSQINPPPLLFATLYVYSHLNLQSSTNMAYTLFTIGMIFAIIFKYNHFYFYSPILNSGIGYWSILNILLGVLASNQRWKFSLFLFVTTDSLTMQYPQISKIYLICCACYIWIDIYKNLLFKTLDDNVIFFTIFFSVFILESTTYLINLFQGSPIIPYICAFFAMGFAYKAITSRISQLKKMQIKNTKNVQIINHYIQMIKQQIKLPYTRLSYLQQHHQHCKDTQCECSNFLDVSQNQISDKWCKDSQYFIIKKLFEDALEIPNLPKRQYIENKFIQLLIQNNQLTKALNAFFKLQSLQSKFVYFRWVQRERIAHKIKQKLNQSSYFNPYSKQYSYVFEYENSYRYLTSQIKQILKKKIIFWKQVGKQSPLMIKLQIIGIQIVQRMYKLNQFYYKRVKQYQQSINNFNGTIMYSMYLLSTTNYKQFAESLIKNTSRTLESIKIHQNNKTQIYCIKVIIRDLQKSCNQQVQNLPFIFKQSQRQAFINKGKKQIISYEYEQRQNNKSKSINNNGRKIQIIDIIANISGSLCKILKTTKAQILNKRLQQIIPSSYQTVHLENIQDLITSDGINHKNSAYQFIDRTRQIPIKKINGGLFLAKINVKIINSVGQGISFVAIVMAANAKKMSQHVNLDGQILESQQQLKNINILEYKQIKQTVSKMKQYWQKYNNISQKTLNININNDNYSITISSPFQSSFTNKNYIDKNKNEQILKPRSIYPPLHIDIINQTLRYRLKQFSDNNNQQQASKCIKKMQSVFYNTETQSTSSSNSSRKTSVVNVLMTFSQNYFIPFYIYIMILYSIIIILTITATTIAYTEMKLTWDMDKLLNNPIYNINSLMDLRSNLVRAVSHQLDYEEYVSNSLLNSTNIQSFIGSKYNNYSTYNNIIIEEIKQTYKEAIEMAFIFVSEILKHDFTQFWSIQIQTVNPNNKDLQLRTQYIPMQNLFSNYYIDLQLLVTDRPYNLTVLSYSFWKNVCPILTDTVPKFQKIVSNQLQRIRISNIIFLLSFIIIVSLSLIPVYISFKKRIKKHIDIYDLIASVQGDLVYEQIKKLKNIIRIVNNSNQSSEVLKTNTINYLARKRSSMAIPKNSGSNQMIQGLVNKTDQNSAYQDIQMQKVSKNAFSINNVISNINFNKNEIKKQQSSLNTNINNQDQIIQQKSNQQIRKRTGELNLQNSEYNSKFVKKHWIIYSMIIINFLLIIILIINKLGYINDIEVTINQIRGFYKNTIEQQLLLLNSKIFYRGLQNNTSMQYKGRTFRTWMDHFIYTNQAQLYPSYQKVSLQHPCNSSNKSFIYCKQNSYSIMLLRQQLAFSLKKIYEDRIRLNIKYNIVDDNISLIPAEQMAKMSELLFYLQTLDDRIVEYTKQLVTEEVHSMIQKEIFMDQQMAYTYISSVVIGVIFLISGLFLLDYMKKLYLKQIIIVSFLNIQMISKNKRVESFLQMLSKSSY